MGLVNLKLEKQMHGSRGTWRVGTFWRRHSTNSAWGYAQDVLRHLREDVLDTQTPHPQAVVGVDTRKAFDSAPHDAFSTKTRELGTSGRLYNFIASFLEGRTYQIQIGQDASSIHHSQVGVPQG